MFWMWVMALLGMMTSYAENVLGIYYRRKDPAGGWRGGPMYYLRDGLGGKPGRVLAVLFAAFCALASFGIGNLSQLNSIAGNLKAAFGVPEAVTGAVLAAVSAVILLGGLKRVAAVAERLVPAMALLYIVGALTVVGVHITAVPAALAAIVKGAFGLQAAGGGIVGYGLSRAVTLGFKRGAFSNEAGLGSSVMVHAASNVKEPVQQGMWGIFEVFADTMVVCTLTALVYQAYWSKEPMVHIAGRRHAQRAGETTEVKIYSNQDSVTLYCNGKKVGTKTQHRIFDFTVTLDEGINILLAVTDKVKDSITLEKVEKEPDSYTLPEFNERQEGVANWFKQMGSLDLKAPMEFPEGFYSVRDTMEEISKNEEALEITSKALKLATNFDIKPGIGMWDMLKTMKPEAMTNMISGIQDGFIESLNSRLIKIKK